MVVIDSLGDATVNLRVYFWFDGHEVSPVKLKSALYRLIKRALMNEGISMPDAAREVVFPQGVPIHQVSATPKEKPPAGAAVIASAAPAAGLEPEPAVSAAEADLSSEEADAEAQAAASIPPEGEQSTLLEGQPPRRS